ncbi:MAG: hypothetical protein NC311_02025 [Muribaculaceae bacterium]|nr:hypothetical protein [Muribaculaceae bacterium]
MTDTLKSLLNEMHATDAATSHGTYVHTCLQNICATSIDDSNPFVAHIKSNPDLMRLFDEKSRGEVPVAGYINNQFVSRRIDRLRIDTDAKTIDILDYKTDTDRTIRRHHYVVQLGEYKKLISEIYPDFDIKCHILWTHDWTLEDI